MHPHFTSFPTAQRNLKSESRNGGFPTSGTPLRVFTNSPEINVKIELLDHRYFTRTNKEEFNSTFTPDGLPWCLVQRPTAWLCSAASNVFPTSGSMPTTQKVYQKKKTPRRRLPISSSRAPANEVWFFLQILLRAAPGNIQIGSA